MPACQLTSCLPPHRITPMTETVEALTSRFVYYEGGPWNGLAIELETVPRFSSIIRTFVPQEGTRQGRYRLSTVDQGFHIMSWCGWQPLGEWKA
jgi:hypothetical protein